MGMGMAALRLQSRIWPSVLTQNADHKIFSPSLHLQYEHALIDYPKKQQGYVEEDEDADGMDPDADADDDTDDWNALGEEDDDDDDVGMDYAEYEDMINRLKKEEETTSESSTSTTDDGDNTSASSSASNDDNVYEDFTSFNASRKKKDR